MSAANSLVGSTAGDQVGNSDVIALANGNYVVRSSEWNNGEATRAGAVTFGDGTTGVSGSVSVANSLVGSTAGDQVGRFGVTELENGNYVVRSQDWDNGGATNAGAVTFGDGTTGVSGPVSAANSLVGSTAFDDVGRYGVTALANGNYLVRSFFWDNGGATDAGAVTFGDGTTGVSGAVSAANSLVGSTAGDQVGRLGLTLLANGNYVVISSEWNNGEATRAGAVTFGDGTTGVSGPVSAANSLVGSTEGDQVGWFGVTALANGNYVVNSNFWDNGGATDAGAVTFGNGTTGVSGPVSKANSLVGSTAGDQVGVIAGGRAGFSGVTALANGNYVVGSEFWVSGGATDAGAVTFGDASLGGTVGELSFLNSVFGLTSDTNLQDVVLDDVNGNFYAPFIDEGGGRVRVGSQASGFLVSPSADFDSDDDIDGADFLAWQRGFNSLYGQGDLINWQSSYGQTPPLAAAAAGEELSVVAFTEPSSAPAISRSAQTEDISLVDAAIVWEFANQTSEEADPHSVESSAFESVFADLDDVFEPFSTATTAPEVFSPNATDAPTVGEDLPAPWLDDGLLDIVFFGMPDQ